MPLTAEEKKLRKAEKKVKRLRAAEERRIKIRKDELAREVETSQANIAEYMKQWYLKNYTARFPHIKRDMEVAWHSFEHSLDVKDFIISELMDQMDEAKIQQAMSWQDYVIKMDDMISDFKKRIDQLNSEHEEDVKALVKKATQTLLFDTSAQTELEEYYKTVLFAMEQVATEASVIAQGEYMTKRDEEDKKGVHNMEMMTAALEKPLKNTVANIINTLQEYKDTTETRRKNLEVLKLKDDYYMDMIKKQDGRMAKLHENLITLQSQVNERQESNLLLEDLKKDREETYTEYMDVRASLTRDTMLDDHRLLTLTSESKSVIKDLQRTVEKGEKILRLGVLCRRLETQEEKVRPFGTPIEFKGDEQMEGEGVNPFMLFWRRYSNAHLTKRKLEQTRETLYKENQELEARLHTAIEIISQICA